MTRIGSLRDPLLFGLNLSFAPRILRGSRSTIVIIGSLLLERISLSVTDKRL
jgi:hypothetical protein